jgi:serine/threonine-protein kinase RsbW
LLCGPTRRRRSYVNIIDHGYSADQPGPASVTLQSNPDQIIATIADRAPAFAPEDAPRPDLTLDLDERKIGGLGLHFIRVMMDEILY